MTVCSDFDNELPTRINISIISLNPNLTIPSNISQSVGKGSNLPNKLGLLGEIPSPPGEEDIGILPLAFSDGGRLDAGMGLASELAGEELELYELSTAGGFRRLGMGIEEDILKSIALVAVDSGLVWSGMG